MLSSMLQIVSGWFKLDAATGSLHYVCTLVTMCCHMPNMHPIVSMRLC